MASRALEPGAVQVIGSGGAFSILRRRIRRCPARRRCPGPKFSKPLASPWKLEELTTHKHR